MHCLLLCCLCSVLSALTCLAQEADAPWPDKLTQQSNFDSFNLRDSLRSVPHSFEEMPSIGEVCKPPGEKDCPAPARMRAYSMHFDDCAGSWMLCYCTSSEVSPEQTTEALSRVPVGIRRQIRDVAVYPGGPSGYAADMKVAFFGGGRDSFGNMLFHEALHVAGGDYSMSPEWVQTIKEDTYLPEDYSKTSSIEAFPATGILMIYLLLHDELPQGFDREGLKHQLAYLEGLDLFNSDTLFGDTCDFEDSLTFKAAHKTSPEALEPSKEVVPPSEPPQVAKEANIAISDSTTDVQQVIVTQTVTVAEPAAGQADTSIVNEVIGSSEATRGSSLMVADTSAYVPEAEETKYASTTSGSKKPEGSPDVEASKDEEVIWLSSSSNALRSGEWVWIALFMYLWIMQM